MKYKNRRGNIELMKAAAMPLSTTLEMDKQDRIRVASFNFGYDTLDSRTDKLQAPEPNRLPLKIGIPVSGG